MQHLDKISDSSHAEMRCFYDCSDEAEPLVIFELVVPVAAKVPASRQHLEIAKLLIQPASITSTVHAELSNELHASSTVQAAGWCVTASLTAQRRRLVRY